MTATSLVVREIQTLEERQAWNQLASQSQFGHMHQCLWWAEPLVRFGFQSAVLGCWTGDQLVGGALFRFYRIPFTRATVGECLNGPIFLEWDNRWAAEFVAAVRALATKSNSMSVVIKDTSQGNVHRALAESLRGDGLPATLSRGAPDAVIPLEGRTPDQVWSGFNRGTRSRIRKAQRGPIKIRFLTDTGELSLAHAAWMATANRKSFSDVRPWSGIEPVLRHVIDNDLGFVLGSFVEERLLAAIFVTQVGQEAVYVYGGYMDGAESYSPTHVLQYEAILESLARGMKSYNFGYLLAESDPLARGVDAFKLGFGAKTRRNLDTITWRRKPLLYWSIERLRGGRLGRALELRLRNRVIRRGASRSGH